MIGLVSVWYCRGAGWREHGGKPRTSWHGTFGVIVFFFFKQKTAYEILRCLVSSEMCIRDRYKTEVNVRQQGSALRVKCITGTSIHFCGDCSSYPSPVSYTHLTLPTNREV